MNDFSVISKRVVGFLRDEFAGQYDPDCVVQLRGDASTRQYFRYHEKNRSFILAVYPDPFDLKDFNYQQMYDLFQKILLWKKTVLPAWADVGAVFRIDPKTRQLWVKAESLCPVSYTHLTLPTKA